jgi:RNA polymerase sigma-70 factor (ECF subfamily)
MTRGDETSFRRFYSLYFDRLYRYLLVVTRGDEELTRDCLQETMLRVVRNIRRFDDGAVLWGWVSRVARTAFLDDCRKRSRRHKTIAQGVWATIPKTEERLLGLLELVIEELESNEKALIMGSYFEGQSHASLAARFDTTTKAIESKLARTRKKMRSMIQERLKHDS